MTTAVSADELIRRALDSRVGDVWTSFPARVKSYDSGTQTAELEPMIRRPVPQDDGTWTSEDLPILPSVKIVFPRGGGDAFAITWPLEPQDHVLVHVTIYSFAAWLRTGEPADPGDLRAHHLANAFGVPGVAPNDKTLDQASDSALVIEGTTIKLGKDASKPPAWAEDVLANLNLLKNAISGAASGDAIPAAVSAVSFQNMAASKVKVQ